MTCTLHVAWDGQLTSCAVSVRDRFRYTVHQLHERI
jgi:hypothetical protein